jgi:hypothetical protein
MDEFKLRPVPADKRAFMRCTEGEQGMRQALGRVWDYIAADVPEPRSLRAAADTAELLIDAGRLEEIVGRDDPAVKALRALTYGEQLGWARLVVWGE